MFLPYFDNKSDIPELFDESVIIPIFTDPSLKMNFEQVKVDFNLQSLVVLRYELRDDGGSIAFAQGTKVVELPLLVQNNSGIHAEIPCDVKIHLDVDLIVEKVETTEITDEDISEAVTMIQRLVDKNKICFEQNQTQSNHTHFVLRLGDGKRLLKRVRSHA